MLYSCHAISYMFMQSEKTNANEVNDNEDNDNEV